MIYRFYGLTLKSVIAIPALQAIEDGAGNLAPDVSFEVGQPAWAVQALATGAENLSTWRSRKNEEQPSGFAVKVHEGGNFFQLIYADGTRFLVDSGANRVWGEPGPGLSYDDVFVYLVGPVAGFILRRRGHVALHASALCQGDKAMALMGPAGAGKSTTAAALALRHWQVCCEDVCVLRETDGKVFVLPGYPRVCLWADSVEMLFSTPDALPLIVDGWSKRYLSLDGKLGNFTSQPVPLAAIYLLAHRSDDPAAPFIRELSQREAALHLVQNTYMNYLPDKNQRALEFDMIARLVSDVPVKLLTPSAQAARIEALCGILEAEAERIMGSPAASSSKSR